VNLLYNRKIQNTLKGIFVVVIALFFGLLGGNLIISDFSPGETPAVRLIFIVLHYILSGFLIGVLFPRLYKYALISTWYTSMIGVVIIIGSLVEGPLGFLTASLMFTPLYLVLFSALLGRGLRNRIRKNKEV
jgi:hypothetical protein